MLSKSYKTGTKKKEKKKIEEGKYPSKRKKDKTLDIIIKINK